LGLGAPRTCLDEEEERMWNPPADRAPAGLTSRNCGLAPALLAGWKMVWPPGREVTYNKRNRCIF